MKHHPLQQWLQRILVTAFISLFTFQSWAVSEIKEAYPDPGFTPSEVVRVQLNAMQQNGPSNFGIEVTFRFASPSNKRFTGPLKRFIQLVKNPSYKHLLNHLDVTFMDPIMKEKMAIQDVIITNTEGKRIGYRFRLSIQEGEKHNNFWMTDAVMPFEVPEISA